MEFLHLGVHKLFKLDIIFDWRGGHINCRLFIHASGVLQHVLVDLGCELDLGIFLFELK